MERKLTLSVDKIPDKWIHISDITILRLVSCFRQNVWDIGCLWIWKEDVLLFLNDLLVFKNNRTIDVVWDSEKIKWYWSYYVKLSKVNVFSNILKSFWVSVKDI